MAPDPPGPPTGHHRAPGEPSIEALLASYTDLIDRGDFAGLGRLFAEGRLVGPDGATLASGADAVEALYGGTTLRHGDGTPRTRHLTTDLVIERSAHGEATVRSSYLVVQRVEAGDPTHVIATGCYLDRVRHDERGWRFAERRMLPGLFGDVSRHLRLPR
jgi:hypothetical protein